MKVRGVVRQALQVRSLLSDRGPRYILWAAATRLSQQLEGPGLVLDPDLGFEQLFQRYRSEFGGAASVIPPDLMACDSLRITWVVLAEPRAGGIANIVNLASALAKRGHANTLCFVNEQRKSLDLGRIGAAFEQAYGPRPLALSTLDRPLHRAAAPPADVMIASYWPTAYVVQQMAGSHLRAYFVQDYEPWFYPRGAEALLADQTYAMDFQFLSLGRWLQQELLARYQKASAVVDFPVDTTIFRPRSVRRPRTFRVAFYVRTGTARRSFTLGLAALRAFAQRAGDDVEIILFGDPFLSHATGFTSLGALSRDQLAELYSSVDVVLSLSATNMSLIPREAAACGAAVVELDLPPVRAHLTHGRDAYLAEPLPAAIGDALWALYRDRDLCRAIAHGGQDAAMALPGWDAAAATIEQALRAARGAPGGYQQAPSAPVASTM